MNNNQKHTTMKRLVLTLAISLAFAFGGVAQSLHYDFEDGTLQGWTVLDGDGDGHCWEPSIGGMGHNSNGMVMAYSRDYATGEPLTPNEYLVSPRLVLSEDWPVIRFYVCALDEIYCAEHFGVSISTTVNNDPLAFTLLHDWTLTAKDAGNRQGNWYNYTVDLSAYTGQEVYVAIRHFNCTDMFAICVDDITIDGTLHQNGLVISPDILTFEEPWVPQTFTISNQTDNAVTISSINVEPDDNVVLLSYGGLPRTLQPNATMNVEVEVNGVGYKGYNTYHVNIATSIGNRQVTVRVNEEAWDEGLLWMPMQGLTFDENSPLTQDFYLYNTNALESITIYELYEAGTDYLALIPSHTLPYVIPPHESLNVSATLVNFPENTTNVNIYCESSLGQGSTPYIHIIGGLTPGSGELVITPDTLWVTEMYQYQNSFTILNVTDHEVVISEVYADDSIVAINHYDPAYGYVDVEDILPITLQMGEDIVLHTYLTNLVEPMAKRSEYIVAPIHIVSTEGEDEVILMIDEAAISFGLVAYLPFYGLDSYEPHQFSLVNAEWSQPITITGIEEVGTDYLEITIEDSLPVTLENYGDYLRGSLKCREPFPFHAFVSTSIIVHTSIGDFGAIGVDIDGTMLFSPIGNEWYYEIENENGSITYQYLYQAGDTIVQDEPTHILVKINTLYDKDLHQDVTHEYVYERDGKLYWWNKTLEEFTVLYDFGAHEGDTWVTKVGTETLTMHVDAEEIVEYEGRFYRMLHVSDTDDIFSGDIVCGIGHLTSFFPERLMDNGDGIRVEGMRCYWVENELVFKYGDEDCDAIYSDIHGVEEESPSSGSGTFAVYPNPTNGILTIHHSAFRIHHSAFRITNLMGQTLLTGQITAENQQINVSSLPQGMYFITFAGETRKFVVR
jgi:hypothetical protein